MPIATFDVFRFRGDPCVATRSSQTPEGILVRSPSQATVTVLVGANGQCYARADDLTPDQRRGLALRPDFALRQYAESRSDETVIDIDGPSFVQCPLSLDVMRDPVVASDGRTYERDQLEQAYHRTAEHLSPFTRAPLERFAYRHRLIAAEIRKLYPESEVVSAEQPPIVDLEASSHRSKVSTPRRTLVLQGAKVGALVGMSLGVVALVLEPGHTGLLHDSQVVGGLSLFGTVLGAALTRNALTRAGFEPFLLRVGP